MDGCSRRGSVARADRSIVGFVAVAALVYWLWARRARKSESEALATLEDMAALGEVVPDTIHPVIDLESLHRLGRVRARVPREAGARRRRTGRRKLLNPLACIGHSACLPACPVEAIKLVFGTAERGVELPRVDPNFQTTRPGVYVIGELGGMGLIRNAVSQGRQAADHVAQRADGAARATRYDAVVVGAGPAGMSATLRLMEAGLPRRAARARVGRRHDHALPAREGRHDRRARVRRRRHREAPHDEQRGARRALAVDHREVAACP